MNTEEYEILIPSQNSFKAKFMEYLRSILNPAVANASVVESFNLAFLIENAAGAQLDIIGNLVGASRILNYEPSYGTREMDDDEYRMCILLTIARNEWDGTNESAIRSYRELLGNNVEISYFDNQDLSVRLVVSGSLSTRMIEIIRVGGYLLVPAGVGANVQIAASDIDVEVAAGVAVTGVLRHDFVIAT